MRINRFLEAELNEVVSGFFNSKEKADIFLSGHFRKKRLGKRDRAWVRDRFYFCIRHKLLFDKLEGTGSSKAKNIAMIFDNEPDEELSIQIEKMKTEKVYDILFNQSFSAYLVDKIKEIYGESVFEWFNSQAETVIRVNPGRISRNDLMNLLENEGCVVEKTSFSPGGLKIMSNESNLKNSLHFEKGFFEFQDESSQLVSFLINRSSLTFLDACAGGGGKSLAVGTFFPRLQLTASDIRAHLFDEIAARAKRAGIKIKTKKHNEIKGLFDTVFVDAPCSGSGVLRRNPADRWIIDRKLVSELIRTQMEILEHYSSFVKSGGELIYVTCSFLKDENEEIIKDFLNKNKNFSIISADARMHENLPQISQSEQIVNGDFFRVIPGHQRDIMFGAILLRS